jgi:Flp pilus assembly protein TadG
MALARILFRNSFRRGNESGTAAIEFALFLVPLLYLLTGTVELGLLMYEAMQVNNAVEAGMLYAAKNGYNSAAIVTATQNAGVVYGAGGPTLNASPTPSQFCGCPSATGVTNLGAPPCSATACSGNPAGTYVQVNATISHLTILPGASTLMPNLPATLTATAVVRTN